MKELAMKCAKSFVFSVFLITFISFTGIAQPADKNVLVIVFSRTGNTAIMAREIADKFSAHIVYIKAEKYSDDFMGSNRANYDAWFEEKETKIIPETVDVTPYNLIFLGSPIWWYRPSVPLWTFVGKNDFQGKNVVLFNTFNSKFKNKYIQEFQQLLESRGGILADHIYVRRGRVINQLSETELIQEINLLLEDRKEKFDRLAR